MADFKFNFEVENSEEDGDGSSYLKPFSEGPEIQQAREIFMPSRTLTFPDLQIDETVTCHGNVRIKHLKASFVENSLKNLDEGWSCDVLRAAKNNSDLVPSVYEGGLKIWECCLDLLEYLYEDDVNFQGKRVLELGCGAGLPGIFALLKGAKVDFQDYNNDVLELLTIPNVFLNLVKSNEQQGVNNLSPVEHETSRCRFFSGDWGSLVDFINSQKVEELMYDVILTSETIYCPESHEKLYRLIKEHLRKPNGVAYVAAKTYYFGVGGGTRCFESLVRMGGVFHISVCQCYNDGVQREILRMSYTEK